MLGIAFLKARILSHGSSPRKRIHVSKVAPPHDSSDQKPTWSNFSAMGSISSMRMRVAKSDWCASRNTTSVIPNGFLESVIAFKPSVKGFSVLSNSLLMGVSDI